MLIGSKTRVGIAVPQMFPDGRIDMDLVSRHLKLVESLGYDSVWTMDGLVATMTSLDPFTLLAYASTVTEKVKLGISVLVMPFQSPINLAKMTASLDQISGGRLIVGVGIGGHIEQYPAFGIDPQHRVTRFEDSVDLLKRLWTEPEVSFQGRFWTLDSVSVTPKPKQQPHPPIWFGGGADPALKRAVRMGDAWMGAGYSTIPAFKKCLKTIRLYLDEAGRDPSSFPVSKRVYIAVDRNKEEASRKLQEWFADFYHDAPAALRVAIFGPEEEVIDRLGELVSEDLDMIMFNPVYDLVEQAERLARDIVPKL